MGKGDGRRREDAARIAENWDRAFAKSGLSVPTTLGVDEGAGEIIINDYDEYRALQRDAKIARHLLKVLPQIHAQMVKELDPAERWPGGA